MYLKHNEISCSDQQNKYVQKLEAKPERQGSAICPQFKEFVKRRACSGEGETKMRLLRTMPLTSLKQFATSLYFNSIFFRTHLLTLSSSVQLWLVPDPFCRCDECDADRTRVDLTKAATSAVI